MNAIQEHEFHHTSTGDGGSSVTCSCGFTTALHRRVLDAVDAWRSHAGLPPIRPDLHPAWCDDIHEQEACSVHVGSFGLLSLGNDDALVTAMLDDSGPDRGLVATVSVMAGHNEVEYRIPLDTSPKPGKRTRKQHAFTVERTAGDHHVWTCSCGDWTRAHAPGDDITPDLIAHSLG